MACLGDDKGKDDYVTIVSEAFESLKHREVIGDELKCYLLAYELLLNYGVSDVLDFKTNKSLLSDLLYQTICKDIAKYGVEYVAVPSDFFPGIYTDFITNPLRELIESEIQMLGHLQHKDGGFDISWKWGTGYDDFETARNWWRPRVTLDKLLFVTTFIKEG